MSRPPPEDRPTPQQLASGNANPWACKGCGCVNWEVRDSRQRGSDPRKRERECRNCGQPLTTFEVPVPAGHKLAIVPIEDEEPERACA